ncbi:MAG: transposase [Gemmataceae bacterium]
MTRKPYPTDLTDTQWERLEPMLPRPKSGTKKGGRPPVDWREIVNAIFYHLRGGSSWELLPHDFPHYKTVFHHFTLQRKSGLWERIHDRPCRGRSRRGRAPAPTGHRPHRQPDRQDDLSAGGDRGYDGGKKGTGSASDSSSSTRWG